jgi:signal peptidase I
MSDYRRAAQQSLAADGAIACFSSSLLLLGLNADRAPQLKAGVGRLSISMVNFLLTTILLLNSLVWATPPDAQREIVAKTGSMLPTIPFDSRLTLDESFYLTHRPRRLDIIALRRVFLNPGVQDELRITIVARIIGLPGETIALRRGRVYINGRRIKEPFPIIRCPIAVEEPFSCGYMRTMRIPAGEYFLLADNRPESLDSRLWFPKTVPRSDVLGKIVRIISPRDAQQSLAADGAIACFSSNSNPSA